MAAMAEPPVFQLHRGEAPLLLSLPHDGTAIPAGLARRMTPAALRVPDTDWHVARLYAFARELGVSVIVPHWSRYVVDLNRAADGAVLYPGQRETGLVPLQSFGDLPLYQAGRGPDPAEVAIRIARYWRPYHDALAGELERLRAAHGRVVLWDGHSIRSRVPMFFEGRLPDLNLGTAGGRSCAPALQACLAAVLAAQDRYTHVVNGRFQGGYITRHYADPARGIDTVQLEIAQCAYMDEDSFEWREPLARSLQPVLRQLLATCVESAS